MRGVWCEVCMVVGVYSVRSVWCEGCEGYVECRVGNGVIWCVGWGVIYSVVGCGVWGVILLLLLLIA